MAEFDFTQAIGEARAKYESIAKALDVDRLKADIKDLETQAAAPGLWDDPENAQKITSRLSAAESQLKRLNSASQRLAIASDLEFMGVKMDAEANSVRGKETVISAADSKVKVLLIPTNEELMIAMDTAAIAKG